MDKNISHFSIYRAVIFNLPGFCIADISGIETCLSTNYSSSFFPIPEMLLRENNSTQLLNWLPSFLEGLVSFYYIVSISVFLVSTFCRASSFILAQYIYVNILILCLWYSKEMYIEIHRCIERYPYTWAVSIFLKDAFQQCSQLPLLNNYTSHNIIPKIPVLSNLAVIINLIWVLLSEAIPLSYTKIKIDWMINNITCEIDKYEKTFSQTLVIF